jgi:hypothetical protein
VPFLHLCSTLEADFLSQQAEKLNEVVRTGSTSACRAGVQRIGIPPTIKGSLRPRHPSCSFEANAPRPLSSFHFHFRGIPAVGVHHQSRKTLGQSLFMLARPALFEHTMTLTFSIVFAGPRWTLFVRKRHTCSSQRVVQGMPGQSRPHKRPSPRIRASHCTVGE